MNKQRISDEQLNAFVDDELGAEEQDQIFSVLSNDEGLNRAVCETRKLQDMLRYAYHEPPSLPPPATQPRRRARLTDAVAASLLLLCGALIGWFSHSHDVAARHPVYLHEDMDAFQTVQLLSAQGQQQNVILHITTADPNKLHYALTEVDDLLRSSKRRGVPIRVEVVANGNGLALLRSKVSPYPRLTEDLIHSYSNLTVMACANALAQLKREGVDTRLLPNVSTTQSALERVVERLQEGWLYIKV